MKIEGNSNIQLTENYLNEVKRDELENIAYATENYIKKLKNIEGGMGGLHDFIWRMDEEQIRNHIINEIKLYPELNNAEKLKSITEDYVKKLTREHNNLEILIERDYNQEIYPERKTMNRKELLDLFRLFTRIVGFADINLTELGLLKIEKLRTKLDEFISKHEDEIRNYLYRTEN